MMTAVTARTAAPAVVHTVAAEARALLTMARKEWIIFRRYPSWVVAFFVWPVLFPFGMIFTAKALSGPAGSALPAFAARAGTTDYMGFIVIGTTLYMWLNVTLWDVGFQLRNEQLRGTLESNWTCPVWRFSILLGSCLTKLGTSLLFFGIAMAEFHFLLGIRVLAGNLPAALLILLLLIPSIYGIGIAFGSLVIRLKEASALVFAVRGAFMIFCGVSYPLPVLPEWMQTVAAYLPLTYAIHGIRAAVLSGATPAELWPDLQALLLFALALPPVAYAIFALTERRARRTGSLGQY
jgi:ABC-2 type transport system permease protein